MSKSMYQGVGKDRTDIRSAIKFCFVPMGMLHLDYVDEKKMNGKLFERDFGTLSGQSMEIDK